MMSIDHYFWEDRNFVLTIASGEIRDKDFVDNVSYVRTSEKLSENYSGIVDCRGVTSFKTPTADAIFSASRGMFSRKEEKQRRLAVLSESKLVYGLARMYELYSSKAEVEIFDTLEAALQWLGMSNDLEYIEAIYGDCHELEPSLQV